MANMKTVEIRGKSVQLASTGTNADLARALFNLPAGYTVTEVSKALGMAYSQAHSIHKNLGKPNANSLPTRTKAPGASKLADELVQVAPRKLPSGQYHKGPARGQRLTEEQATRWDPPPPDPKRRAPKVVKGKLRDGKLRTGPIPSDIKAGPCANCGFDLVVRRGPYGYMFVHTNATPEDYLAKIQFCQAVPESLL